MDDIKEKKLAKLIYACDYSADRPLKETLLIALRQKLASGGSDETELPEELLDKVAGGVTGEAQYELSKKKNE